MTWTIDGDMYEACSCKMICRCTMGPAEPDQGWCSAAQVIDVQRGRSGDVDLGGVKVAVALQLPGDFFSGVERARLYVDGSDAQRAELEAIFRGERGGVWAGLKDVISEWLPTRSASITISGGDSPAVKVEGAGELTLTPVRNEAGEQAQLQHAPVPAAFGIDVLNLHDASGSGWSDSELRAWESLGYGASQPVHWSD